MKNDFAIHINKLVLVFHIKKTKRNELVVSLPFLQLEFNVQVNKANQ